MNISTGASNDGVVNSKNEVSTPYAFKLEDIDSAVSALKNVADPVQGQQRFLSTVIAYYDNRGNLKVETGVNRGDFVKENNPELLLALIEKVCDTIGDQFGQAINSKKITDAKHIHEDEKNLLKKLETIKTAYLTAPGKGEAVEQFSTRLEERISKYRERVEKHGTEIYQPSTISKKTPLEKSESLSDFEQASPRLSVAEGKHPPTSESFEPLSPPPSPLRMVLPKAGILPRAGMEKTMPPKLIRKEGLRSIISEPMEKEDILNIIPALRSVAKREFNVGYTGYFSSTSNLKQAARQLADGKELKVFPEYSNYYDGHETALLESVKTFEPENAADWSLFYAKMCVLDADPDFSKLHEGSPLATDLSLIRTLENGIRVFKQLDNKFEATDFPEGQPDRVLVKNIGKTFSSILKKLERTRSQALDLVQQSPAERNQIYKELRDIARGWHLPLEAHNHKMSESEVAKISIGKPDNTVKIHLQGKKDLSRESFIIGGKLYPSPGNDLSKINVLVAQIKTLFNGDPRLTDEHIAEILTLTCNQTVFAPLQLAAQQRPNSPQMLRQIFDSHINSVEIDYGDIVITRGISYLTVDPEDPENLLPEKTTTLATIRIPKETFLSHLSLGEVTDEEANEWETSYTITRGPA